jgi:UDP-glucuronate 4-epimerase
MNETIEMLENIAGRRLDVQRAEAVAGDQRRTKADTKRIRDDLGWQPTTSLEEGLRAQWEWAAVESPA